jgi:hypothetical protein
MSNDKFQARLIVPRISRIPPNIAHTALSSNMQYVISSERGERGAGNGGRLYLMKVESAVSTLHDGSPAILGKIAYLNINRAC